MLKARARKSASRNVILEEKSITSSPYQSTFVLSQLLLVSASASLFSATRLTNNRTRSTLFASSSAVRLISSCSSALSKRLAIQQVRFSTFLNRRPHLDQSQDWAAELILQCCLERTWHCKVSADNGWDIRRRKRLLACCTSAFTLDTRCELYRHTENMSELLVRCRVRQVDVVSRRGGMADHGRHCNVRGETKPGSDIMLSNRAQC